MGECRKPSFLMCPPDFYGIEYEINPWMSRRRDSIPEVAQRQWHALCETLTGPVGATVHLLEPVECLPDMVFTANAGLVWGETFIASNFRFAERQREAPHYEAWFVSRGYRVVHLPEEHSFEGAGDMLALGETLFAGYHFRSDIRSHTAVSDLLGSEVLSLQLVDKWFYHLDTCFCPLGAESAFYYPAAFDDYANRVIEARVDDPIAVSPGSARRFACNAVVVDRHVVLNTGCDDVVKELTLRGYTVHEEELSEFIKAGGSAKCLTLELPA